MISELRRRSEPTGRDVTLDAATLTCSTAGRVAEALLSGAFRPGVALEPQTAPAPQPPPDSFAGSAGSSDSSSFRLPEGSELATLSACERQYYRSVARIGWQVAQALEILKGLGFQTVPGRSPLALNHPLAPERPAEFQAPAAPQGYTFEPLADHREDHNLGLVASQFSQPQGLYRGRIDVPGKGVVQLDRVPGVAERQRVRW